MQCLIDDLEIVACKGLTIISDQDKGIIKAAEDIMPLAEHRQYARHIYANFKKKFNIEAKRNPIINMLEDIRIGLMERMQRMRGNMKNGLMKERFGSAYNHYIEGINRMDQWPSTSYRKLLSPIKRRMPGRSPHKRKRDASENDGNMSMISRGQINNFKLYNATRHNQRACLGKEERMSTSDGVRMRGARVRMTGSGVRIRGGAYIRGNSHLRNTPTSSATSEARSRGLRTINGKVVRSRGRGDESRSRMYLDGIRPI
ncbi:hypothetical protein Tco_0593467 [Tanacetum coccineum]